MENLSLYIHIPFCQHRCGYCDFNTFTGYDNLIPKYVQVLTQEIALVSQSGNLASEYNVHSIYFGGGTPSLLKPNYIRAILGSLGDYFNVLADCEITLEANPGTVVMETLKGYHSAGVNRLSLGAQSTHQSELVLLERMHNFQDVENAVQYSRNAGINNISMDLIYGLPHQYSYQWEKSLQAVINLEPDHLSLYSLTIEEGTPFKKLVSTGQLPYPDPDQAAEMYEMARSMLSDLGFVHYEISNWAKLEKDHGPMISRHNSQYWRNESYLGFGAGAHGFIAKVRLQNEPNLIRYINAFSSAENAKFPATPATIKLDNLNEEQEMRETMMMGLRLVEEGVSSKRFFDRFGIEMQTIFGRQIYKLISKGLLEWAGKGGDTLRLTKFGHLLANQVFIEFI